MEARGRALFNLLRMNWEENSTLGVEPWQVENYRSLSTDTLFERLRALEIPLDEERFGFYSEKCSCPEELTDTLWAKDAIENFDEAYLLIFELWRRLFPEKQSLSIFCDELDHLIDLYDSGKELSEEKLQDTLGDLKRVLDEHSDQGQDAKHIFREISLFCAHDLESFIYDYASNLIDEGQSPFASDLIDGFFPYIHDGNWFVFLQLRLMYETDSDEAQPMLERLLEDLQEEPDFELLLEITRFLVTRGAIHQFRRAIHQARNSICTEQDFQELLALSCEFYRLLDREKEAHAVANMLLKRQGNPLEQELPSNDKAIQDYYRLFEDLDPTQA